MPVKPFESPKLKIARANKHINELESEICQYLNKDPIAPLLIRKKTTNTFDVQLLSRVEIPGELSVIFGDMAHNLRSALDNLINDSVALCGAIPKNVYFPFAKNKSELETQIKKKMRGATDDIKDIVRNLEPYKGGNIILRALHDLDIRDKHKTIITQHCRSSFEAPLKEAPPRNPGTKLFVVDIENIPTVPIEKTGWPIDRRSYEIIGKIRDSNAVLIIKEDLPLGKIPVIEAAIKMRDLTQRIVKAFEAHFKRGHKSSP